MEGVAGLWGVLHVGRTGTYLYREGRPDFIDQHKISHPLITVSVDTFIPVHSLLKSAGRSCSRQYYSAGSFRN